MSEGRFEVVRPLGAGGFGSVSLVRDAARGELVARKRLRGSDPVRAATLTRELRIAGSLDHPNVVRVLELGHDRGGPYLLVEHVDGEDLRTHCRGETDLPGPRWDRLAGALPQLLAALRFLHERGIAHGDLKPENVLVRRDGLLKIVDFGLATREGEALHGGTPTYLAPERRRGAPPSAAADRWALGVMLREITAGASLRELSAIIEQLLDPDPARRPSIARLEEAVLPALGATPVARRASPGEVVDREALIARVHGTLLAGQRSVVLTGPAGAGKTTVAREVARLATAAGFPVLAARARPEARVAFHLVDELLELALPHIDADVETREILRRLEPISQAAAVFMGEGAASARIRREVHERLFGARPPRPRAQLATDVSALLSASGDRVLLFIDDLQWADPDSRTLVHEILDAPGAIAMLATSRTAIDARSLEVPVPPLSHAGLTAMLVGRGLDEEQAAEIARRSAGSPGLALLNEQLSALGAGLLTQSARERKVLAAILVADGPLATDDLPPSAVDALCRRGLLVRRERCRATAAAPRPGGPRPRDDERPFGSGLREGELVELAHDALRGPLTEALGNDWVRAAHLRRARQLAGRVDRDADRVRHLVGAGEASEAARIAPAAAARLTSAGGHALAAELLDIARQHGPFDSAIAEQRALALERAQRFADAAQAWAELGARAPDRDERARFTLAEALALLNARRIGEGRERLDVALVSAGEAPLGARGARAASTVLRFLAGPLLPARLDTGAALLGRAREGERLTLTQAKGFLRSAAIVGYFDTLSGLRLLSRLRDVFDGAGDAEHAAWCDYLLAFFARFLRVGGGWLSARYRAAAERRLAHHEPRIAIVREFPRFLDAYARLREGCFAEALAGLEVALEAMEGSGEELSFEVQLVLSLRTSAVLALQDVGAAEAAVGRFEAAAREGLDVAIQCHVENAQALVATWRGRFEEALARMEALRREWPREPVTVQSILIEAYAALPAVLLGDARAARRRLREALERGRRFRIFRSAYGPIVAAIAALAELASGEGDRARARRWAALASARPSVMQGLGERVLCYLEGETLRAAAERAALRGQPLDAALARLIDADASGDRASAAAARAALAELGASARLLEEASAVGPFLHGRRSIR